MISDAVTITCATHKRATEINRKLCADSSLTRHCTIVYVSDTELRLETLWPRCLVDWLIAAEILDPTMDDYAILEHDDDD